MAVIGPQTAPNFAMGEYHRILKAEYQFFPGTGSSPIEPMLVMHVGFYYNEAARDMNPQNPMWTNVVSIPVKDLNEDPRKALYDTLMNTPLFSGTNAVSDATAEDATKNMTLEMVKARKVVEITMAKVQANRDFFVFRGKRVQADESAMLEIQTTMNGVLARGALRSDWAGGWLAMDNSIIPIPDVATWFEFYAAIEATGQANFNYSRDLKALVAKATSINQVQSVHWGIDLATFVLPADDTTPAPAPAPDPAPPPAA